LKVDKKDQKIAKKLVLHKETVRVLTESEIKNVVGGRPKTFYFGCTNDSSGATK
jgi:hypothetical protein